MGVIQFYKGKNVLVTGATGFMGKCLVEKLLRTFPDVGHVFVMIRDRPKVGTYLQQYKTLLQNPVFSGLRSTNPNFADKIIPVYGDLLLPKFGMKSADIAALNSSVHVVFHSAATVSFRQPVRNAVKTHMIAMRELCDMCRNFQHLESMVHMSTAYINLPEEDCEERIYPIDVSTVVTAYDYAPDKKFHVYKSKGDNPKHIDARCMVSVYCTPPNRRTDLYSKLKNDDAALAAFDRQARGRDDAGIFTYARTKKMGENILVDNSNGMPLVIVRPSVIIAALNEPYPGWRDGSHGLGPILEQIAKGERTMVFGDPEKYTMDIIHVDMSVNICLAAAWYRATQLQRQLATDDIPIFNSVNGKVNPIYQSQIYEYAKKYGLSARASRQPVTIYKSMVAYRWNELTKPLLLAFPKICWLAMTGRKNRMVEEAYYRYEYVHVWAPVTNRSCNFRRDKVDHLQTLLSSLEKQLLPMDPRTINWETYMENYCRQL